MNIGSIFKKWQMIVAAAAALMPLVNTAITTVEALFPEGGSGAAKLEAVKQILAAAWSKVQGAEATFEEVWPMLEGVIAALIAVLNNFGLFKKSSPPAQ